MLKNRSLIISVTNVCEGKITIFTDRYFYFKDLFDFIHMSGNQWIFTVFIVGEFKFCFHQKRGSTVINPIYLNIITLQDNVFFMIKIYLLFATISVNT